MTGTLTSSRASAPSETSPLLGDRNSGDAINGDAENGRLNGNHVQEPVKAKLHLILPAVGIGVYMVAIDQLLTVATYAKIGNELNALNNTSWIATA